MTNLLTIQDLSNNLLSVDTSSMDVLVVEGVGAQGPGGGGGGGVSDHGALTGLADDDHTQYHNNTRGDERYSQLGHTHTASQVTDFSTAADARIAAQKGVANGLAPLESDSKIAAIYLPSYVDDVLEYANLAAFPGTGATGVIYVALDTNKTYRWSGSAYVEISPSPGSTDSVTEGSTNLYHTTARARSAAVVNSLAGSQTDQSPSVAQVKSALDAKLDDSQASAFGLSFLAAAGAAAGRSTLGIASRAIIFGAVTPGNDTLYLTTYAPFAFTIDSVQNIQTSAGTITAAVKINGTNVTGLSSISVTSSSQDVNASGANSVAIGDEVTVVLSSNSSAANLRGTILITM